MLCRQLGRRRVLFPWDRHGLDGQLLGGRAQIQRAHCRGCCHWSCHRITLWGAACLGSGAPLSVHNRKTALLQLQRIREKEREINSLAKSLEGYVEKREKERV